MTIQEEQKSFEELFENEKNYKELYERILKEKLHETIENTNSGIEELIYDDHDYNCTCRNLVRLNPCREYHSAFAFRIQECNVPGHPKTNPDSMVQGELARLNRLEQEEDLELNSTDDEEEDTCEEDTCEEEEEEEGNCYCGDEDEGKMVGCENGKNCAYEWFHLGCVGLMYVPKGEWYCQDCCS